MSVEVLKSGWVVDFVMTMMVVVFGLYLIKRGALALYEYYSDKETPGVDPLTRTLVLGISQAAAGVLLIISFLISSPYSLTVFPSG